MLISALLQILLKRIAHEVDFGVGHGGVERQGEFVVADVLAFGGGVTVGDNFPVLVGEKFPVSCP